MLPIDQKRPQSAFTLIELLVVIAIIAILAAILFPVFAQAKAAAKDTATLSGTKQIGLGTVMYTNDYDDTMPLPTGTDYYNDPTTLEVLYPYVKNANLFWDTTGGVYAGAKPMVDGGAPDNLTHAWGWWDWNITISMNQNAATWWTGSAYQPRVVSAQQFPSQLCDFAVIRAPGYNDDTIGAPMFDGTYAICSTLANDTMGNDTYANYWSGMLALGASRHSQKIIGSFIDGHAGHKPVNSVVLQSCTQYSTAYWNWYAKPTVANFIGTYWDGTQ